MHIWLAFFLATFWFWALPTPIHANSTSENQNLEARIKSEFNISIRNLDNFSTSPSQRERYTNFLRSFINEANKRRLGRRVQPADIQYVLGADRSFNGNMVALDSYDPRSMIRHIESHFPQEGTPAAEQLLERNRSVRKAIMDRLEALKALGFETIRASSHFSARPAAIDTEDDIGYFRQEDLLRGLMRLENLTHAGRVTYREHMLIDDAPTPAIGLDSLLAWVVENPFNPNYLGPYLNTFHFNNFFNGVGRRDLEFEIASAAARLDGINRRARSRTPESVLTDTNAPVKAEGSAAGTHADRLEETPTRQGR